MYLRRSLEARVRQYLEFFPAIAITGPRQSGKTTLVRSMLPDCPYVSFDDPEEVRASEIDPRGFLSRYPDRVILDEAQSAPSLFPYLKMEIDAKRERPGRFILTGSNQFALARGISESLAGRVGLLSLLPFERMEMPLEARAGQLLHGSYPELVARDYVGTKEWYSSYLGTYLERDVRLVHGIGKLSDFRSLLQLLAIRSSQEYNASSLARDLGVDSKTIEAWVSVLEASYIVFRLLPFHANIGKRLVKRPKLYFWDTGLLCHLAGLRNDEALKEGPLGGPVFENLAVAEILKGAAHRGFELKAFYFRESNGLEADLILEDPERQRNLVIDIKAGQTAKAPWIGRLSRIAELIEASAPANRSPFRATILYRGESLRDWPSPKSDFINYEEAIAEWQE